MEKAAARRYMQAHPSSKAELLYIPPQILPFPQGQAGGGGIAAEGRDSLRPTTCHLSARQGTKSCETNTSNTATMSDVARLCCQEPRHLRAGRSAAASL